MLTYILEDQGVRPYQEDRHSVEHNFFEDCHFFAVYDGHGGDRVSNYLQLYLKDTIKNELMSNNTRDMKQCLKNAFDKINNNLNSVISAFTGSTALVCIIAGKEIYVANVGDSRAILNKGSSVIEITRDHKPDDLEEQRLITRKGGRVEIDQYGIPRVNGVLSLSRAIGDKYLQNHISNEPDIKSFDLTPENKFIVIATDGLWDVFTNEEVNHIIFTHFDKSISIRKSLNTIGNILLSNARIRGSGDNITIIIVSLYS